jgi:hypothetical protein
MKKHAPTSPYALPMIMGELTLASWETIWHRTLLMAQGTCTAAEDTRMMTEKTAAVQLSTVALMAGRSHAAVLAPFVSRARANAKRLRRGK